MATTTGFVSGHFQNHTRFEINNTQLCKLHSAYHISLGGTSEVGNKFFSMLHLPERLF